MASGNGNRPRTSLLLLVEDKDCVRSFGSTIYGYSSLLLKSARGELPKPDRAVNNINAHTRVLRFRLLIEI